LIGHGNATYDKFEMRIHKRIVDVQADERTLKQILRVGIPQDIHVEIKLIG
jgi:small subunit ribosomal protein S10